MLSKDYIFYINKDRFVACCGNSRIEKHVMQTIDTNKSCGGISRNLCTHMTYIYTGCKQKVDTLF